MSRTAINWAGPYSASATYTVGDLATSGGAGYVSIAFPNTGNPLTDTTHWSPIGILSDATSWATLAHATIVTVNGGSGGGTKAVPQLNWPAPAAIAYGTPLSSAQLNCTANALGSFTYSQPLGTVLSAGTQTLTVTFTPLDTTVYASATATVTLAVAQATPAITWPQPPSLLYTDALSGVQLNAAASCSGTFTYSPPAGTVLAAGTATLTATFTPADPANYTSASATRSLTVTAVAPPASLVSGQTAGATVVGSATPITLTLPSAPTPGHQLTVILGYSPALEYDYTAPDATWSVTLVGRSGPSAGGANRVLIATHTVVPGDGTSYTFYPGIGNGGGCSAYIFESSGTTGLQLAAINYNHTSSQVTPTLTPTSSGSLAVAFDFSAWTYPLASGWAALPSAPFGVAQMLALSDASTPISTTFGGYSPNDALVGLLLFAPGPLCATPVASPAPGSTSASSQTVSLACTTSGTTIHYTLDGSLPTSASPVYSAPFTFDRTTTLGVLAVAPGYVASGPALYQFVVAAGTVLGVGLDGNLNGYVPFANDLLHVDLSASPVDANSSAALANLASSGYSNVGVDTAIGVNVVDSTPGHAWTTPLVPLSLNVSPADQSVDSDGPTLAPMPQNLYIEGRPPTGTLTGDNHGLVFDRGNGGVLYENYRTINAPAGGARPTQFSSSNLSIFDLTLPDTMQRAFTKSSASAGGCSVFEGIPRYDEVMSAIADGSMCLKHATRMTASFGFLHGFEQSGDCYGYFQKPCTHTAGTHPLAISDPTLAWYGMRLRLKSSYNPTGLDPVVQVLVNTWKRFGYYMEDIGQTFIVNVCYDRRWNMTALNSIQIPYTNLEVVQRGTIYSEAAYPHGAAPVINSFTSSAPSVPLGGSVTLSCQLTGASYAVIDLAGFIRSGQPITWTPTARGTFTLEVFAQGQFLENDDPTGDGNRVTASLTVTVT